MRTLISTLALAALFGCTATEDAEGSYKAFMRSCEPATVRADTRDGDGTQRTLVMTCQVVKR